MGSTTAMWRQIGIRRTKASHAWGTFSRMRHPHAHAALPLSSESSSTACHACSGCVAHVTMHRSSRRRVLPACHASDPSSSSGSDPSSSSGSDPSSGSRETSSSGSSSAVLRGLRDRLAAIDDTNVLQTGLAAAISVEEYHLASLIRDRLEQVTGGKATRIDWSSLEVPVWLADRLERLGYKFPTEVQRRAAWVLLAGMDAAIQSETGSGKTLAFLVPMLSRMRYPPEVFPDDLKGPQAIIVVPTQELGVQVCLLAYRMFGGSVSVGKPGDPANLFTYFGPRGILVRGLLSKEEVVMAKETAYLAGTHLVVATPAALVDVYTGEDSKPILDHLLTICVDEFDECFQKFPEATMLLLSSATKNNAEGKRPQVVVVGATLSSDLVTLASSAGWLRDPVTITVGKVGHVPSSLKHRFVVCDASRHLAVLVRMLRQDMQQDGQDSHKPARTMVFAASPEDAAAFVEPLRSALWMEHAVSVLLPPGSPLPSPAPGSPASTSDSLPRSNPPDPEAKAAASHELAGSSPFSAIDPITALLSFRDKKTSLLLCTPQAARGLDLPAVSHVYSLGCPTDAAQYLHRAGRAGRIGLTGGGTVTTILTPEEVPALTAIMAKLGLSPSEQQDSQAGAPLLELGADAALEVLDLEGSQQVEKLRKGLEDIFNLM